jgi:hypothetical protein
MKPLLAHIQAKEYSGEGNQWDATHSFLSSTMNSAAASQSFQTMDILWFIRPFSSVPKGPRGEGSLEKGKIYDYPDYEEGSSRRPRKSSDYWLVSKS